MMASLRYSVMCIGSLDDKSLTKEKGRSGNWQLPPKIGVKKYLKIIFSYTYYSHIIFSLNPIQHLAANLKMDKIAWSFACFLSD